MKTIRNSGWMVAVVGITLLTFTGFLGAFHWALDVFSHFRLQYLVISAVLLIVGLILAEDRRWALVIVPALVANLLVVVPFFMPIGPEVSAAGPNAPSLRVMTVNAYAHNDHPSQVIDYIEEVDADLVLISELSRELWQLVSDELETNYPFMHVSDRLGHFGIVLLSKFPFDSAQTNQLGSHGYPSIQAVITLGDEDGTGQAVTIYGAHPHPPLWAEGAKRRDTELADIQAILRQIDGPLILMGDLNASPWSAPLRAIVRETSIGHGAKGFGIWPTWWYRTRLDGIPYDHVLVSPHWQITDYRNGRDVGSDHMPVVAEMKLISE